MKKPTLDEFIAAYNTRRYPANLYVREPGFKSLYVRMNPRLVGDRWHDPTLDLANIEARWPGKGYFTRLVERLRHDCPHLTLYVESVFDARFQARLERLSFTRTGAVGDCFVLRGSSVSSMASVTQDSDGDFCVVSV